MRKESFIFVANWKMQKTVNDSIQFIQRHVLELSSLTQETNSKLIVCPSFLALYPLKTLLAFDTLFLGAQTCSTHEKGAYTGEIDAFSLAQLNCTYCIVGHSEQRQYHHITTIQVAQKTERLLAHALVPIVCIGETEEEYKNKKTASILHEQLIVILETIQKYKHIQLYIAYEPLWAIGTGRSAQPAYIQEIMLMIKKWLTPYNGVQASLLYGGSIDETNIETIAQIPQVDGVLIGSASLDFKKLKNIVLLHKKHR